MVSEISTVANNNMWLDSDLLYDPETYLWVRYLPDSLPGVVLCQIGASRPALESLGDVSLFHFGESLPNGTIFSRGDIVGSLEAAKMTTEVVTPVSGKFLTANLSVLEDPLLVSKDPYLYGWLFMMVPHEWNAEKGRLLSADELLEHLPDDLRGPSEH